MEQTMEEKGGKRGGGAEKRKRNLVKVERKERGKTG